MLEVGRVSRAPPVHKAVRNCTRDEQGPFGLCRQGLIPRQRKLVKWPNSTAGNTNLGVSRGLLWVKSYLPEFTNMRGSFGGFPDIRWTWPVMGVCANTFHSIILMYIAPRPNLVPQRKPSCVQCRPHPLCELLQPKRLVEKLNALGQPSSPDYSRR